MIARQSFWIAACLALFASWNTFVGAQDKQEPKPVPKADDPLANRQKQIADQIQRLESLLLRSADIEAIDIRLGQLYCNRPLS